jgi:hypothetical protein
LKVVKPGWTPFGGLRLMCSNKNCANGRRWRDVHNKESIMSRKASVLMASIGAALISSGGSVWAQQVRCDVPGGNYGLTLRVGPECGAAALTTAQQFFDRLDTNTSGGLRSVLPIYNNTSIAALVARFNGVTLNLNFPTQGSTLQFNIPELSYSRTITGVDRDNSLDELTEELKRGDILSRIMSYQAKNSPTSPITGVGGLIPSVIAVDFNQNFTGFATNIAAPQQDASVPGANSNLAGAALVLGSFTATGPDGFKNKIKVGMLPLSYTFRNDIDPRRQLTLSLPLAQVDVNGANTYSVGLGGAYRFPINDNWTVVPSGRVSGVGSVDLATVSGVYTVGVTSVYVWEMGSFTVAMGNMLSFNSTLKFKGGEYSFDPNINNTATRNGLLLSQPAVIDGRKLSVEYSFVDTRFIGGSKPYVSDYQEVGITVGTNKNAFSSRTFIRGGVTVTRGKGTNGVTANIGYWF